MTLGAIDESDRLFLPNEKRLAEILAGEGKQVKALLDVGIGRKPDALVDGVATEFKSLQSGANSSRVVNVVDRSLARGGQAGHIIIDARRSGLSIEETKRAFMRIRNIKRVSRLDYLRVIGDGFDVFASYP